MATQFYTKGRGSVFRWVEGPDGTLMQKWTGTEWIHWPDLIAASGMGGDTSYEEITKAEAQQLMKRDA